MYTQAKNRFLLDVELVDQSAAERLIVLGDFLHAIPLTSETWMTTLSQELDLRASLDMRIVAGNHDKEQGQSRIDARIQWSRDAVVDPPFVYQHEPKADPRGYVLAGHIHPAYRISQSKRSGIRAPVFHFTPDYAVLPAFGSFTGGHTVSPKNGDALYRTGPDSVIQVPASHWQASSA